MKAKLFLTFALLVVVASAFTSCSDKDEPDSGEKVPEDLIAIAGESSVTLIWSPVDTATYNVYHSIDNKSYSCIAEGVSSTTYCDNTPVKGINYYKVTAIIKGAESGFSAPANTKWPLVGDEWIDSEFAKLLQEKGYIKDASTVTPADVAELDSIVVSFGSSTNKLKSLRGIEYFVSLEFLRCTYNQLTQLDLSKNTRLTFLMCNNNELTQLDVSKNSQLTNLYCQDNQLTQLDVSKNSQLKYLRCDSNHLTQLDFSKNSQLKGFDCGRNKLTQLDVSKNSQLDELRCSENQLTKLDLSKNTALKIFLCHNNPGANGLFRVKAWFDNSNVPSIITNYFDYESSWTYNGSTVSIFYYK